MNSANHPPTSCGCTDGRTLDQLLMDYLLWGDPTAAAQIPSKKPLKD